VYPDREVEELITTNFLPARFHVKEQPEAFGRFGAEWTPTILIMDPDGTQRHKIEGFLPKGEFLGQLRLGLAHAARLRGDFENAEKLYRELADDNSVGDAAPEALYWAGVSKYKGTNDGDALTDTAKAFKERFQDTAWAKRAAVWGG
jgi:TolA-binding protein